MYRAFYELKSKPFQISSDPAFLWLGEKHKEALATLRYGILDNKGFLLLTGDVGTGKTTLINTLIKSLGNDVICTFVPDPNLEKIDFLNYIARGFGIDHEISSKGQFLVWFSNFLHTSHANNKKVLLIIDEAQLLTQELLEEIRLLSNVEKAETKLLNIFFIGQNEFNEILTKPINRAVRQRLTLNYNIEPISLAEIFEYIEFRLKIAGTTKRIFTKEAVKEIYYASKGFPRRINILCDHALLTGYVKDKKLIDPTIIRECARELDIPIKQIPHNSVPSETVDQIKPLAQSPVKPQSMQGSNRLFGRTLGFLFLLVMFFSGAYLFYPDTLQNFFLNIKGYLNTSGSGELVTLPGNIPIESYPIKALPEPVAPTQEGTRDLTRNTVEESIKGSVKGSISESISDPIETETQVLEKSAQILESPLPHPESVATPLVAPVLHVQPPVLEDKVIVRFRYNNNDFTDQGFEDLTRFADSLVFYPEARVIIKGYTDSDGSQIYNKKLSEFRANIVKSFLLGKGANSEQIETLGLGSENPMETNDSPEGRMMNRRVEIEVISK